MRWPVCLMLFLSPVFAPAAFGQDLPQIFEGRLSLLSVAAKSATPEIDAFTQFLGAESVTAVSHQILARFRDDDRRHVDLSRFRTNYDFTNSLFRGQSPEADDGGGGAGAAAATDPSQPLTQFQLQNSFIPSTYASDGYSNVFVLQPVIPLKLNWDGIPYHIIRPTLPVISPTADPNGPLGVEGGLGDLTILDVYIRPFERWKTNIGVGPVVIAPTSSHRQLGLGEWQLGPTIFVVSKAVPKWNLGGLVQVPFSMESDAYTVQMQPIVVRTLPDEWYVGVGDLLWKIDDQNGGYDIPLSVRVGKVLKFGDHLLNISLQPQYTPRGFHSGETAEWGIKLSVTFLLPDVKLTDPLLAHDECCRCPACCYE